jgi:hypothetical protein
MRILAHLYSSAPKVKDTTLNLMQLFDVFYLAKDKENWNVEVVELWGKVTLHYNNMCPCTPNDFIKLLVNSLVYWMGTNELHPHFGVVW